MMHNHLKAGKNKKNKKKKKEKALLTWAKLENK